MEKFYHRIKRKIFLCYCSWQNKSRLPGIFWKDRLRAAYWLQMYLLPIAYRCFRVILLYLKIFKIFFLDTFLSYNFLVGMMFSFKLGSLPFTLQDKNSNITSGNPSWMILERIVSIFPLYLPHHVIEYNQSLCMPTFYLYRPEHSSRMESLFLLTLYPQYTKYLKLLKMVNLRK